MRSVLTKLKSALLERLKYPELRGLELDAPQTTIRRREVLERNRSARFSFARWYSELADLTHGAPDGLRLELGSGGGFLHQFVPGLLTTDVVELPFVARVCRAESLPFANASVSAIFMVNVLHHVSDPAAFFREAARTLKPGGVIGMVEPFVSGFSRFVYRHLHHEPFDPDAQEWRLPRSGRLSGGNDALPWIILVRDRPRFDAEFPEFSVERLRPHSALSHLLSGGVTTRPLAPFALVRALAGWESRHPAVMRKAGLFFTIALRRASPDAPRDRRKL